MPTNHQFRTWVSNNTHVFATAPDMTTPAPKSGAVRFRWFNVVALQGQLYTLGANVHPDNGGALGGMWISGNGVQGIALHPHAWPTIPQQAVILGHLRGHLNAGNVLYDYENEAHLDGLMGLGDVFG